jgi:Tol biopolymer transport system component/DNA-binding winged helix-turn-helix (wHTH) protein
VAFPVPDSPRVRFGRYELDPSTGRLLKEGIHVKLQPQPFRVLLLLASRPGLVVTREEIQRHLWGGATFVDFERGINFSINQIRAALCDDADKPRYVETLPRVGYRFIGTISASEPPRQAVVGIPREAGPTDQRPPEAKLSPRLRDDRVKKTSSWVAVATTGLLAVGLMFWLGRSGQLNVTGSARITNDGALKTDLVTDGSRLYVTEIAAGHTILSQVSVTGGEPAQVPTPFASFRLGGLSPNGTELLLAGSPTAFPTGDLGYEFPLWVLPLPTGSPRRVGDVVANDASWSSDGLQIVYTHGHDLYLCNREGGQARKLASILHYPLWPRWSPKNDVVRFTEYDLETNATSLWEVSVDGTHLSRLLPGRNESPQECCGNWTSDGKFYFFQSDGNIWAINEKDSFWRRANGRGKAQQLTFGPLALTNLAAGPDGKKLFVVGQERRAELVRYDSQSHEFVGYLSGISGGQLDFSRDGKWIAYVVYPGETLWRCRVDGSERQQLTHGPLRVALPHWSPDGQRIAIMAAEPGKRWKLFLVSASGEALRDAMPELSNVGDPSWSADGSKLAFGFLAVDASSPPSAIQLLDLASNKISSIQGSEGMFSPRWSPNGRYLVAISADSERLMLFDWATRKWSTLSNQTIGYPTWSRDSKFVYFDDTSFTAEPAFYRVRISDRRLETVMGLKKIRQFSTEWPFGAWTGLAPDDSPLLQRDIGTQEIYALDLEDR